MYESFFLMCCMHEHSFMSTSSFIVSVVRCTLNVLDICSCHALSVNVPLAACVAKVIDETYLNLKYHFIFLYFGQQIVIMFCCFEFCYYGSVILLRIHH